MKKTFLFLLMAIILSIGGWAQNEITIGSGTSTSNMSAMPGYYGFHYSAARYTSTELAELPAGSTISSISYQLGTAGCGSVTLAIYLYEASTISGTWADAQTNGTEVFNGSVTTTPNAWMEVSFTTPYTYNGADLIVVVKAQGCQLSGTYSSAVNNYYYFGGDEEFYNTRTDDTPPSSTASMTASESTYKPIIKLAYSVSGTDYCAPVSNLSASNLSANGADISWSDDNAVNNYIYNLKKSSDSWDESNETNTSSLSVSLSNLQANTSYDFKVKTDCSNDSFSAWRTISFTTPCVALTAEDLPKTWDFESDNNGGTANYLLPSCWSRFHPQYPKISQGSEAHSGNNYLWFYDPNRFVSITPVDVNSVAINELQVSFYAKFSTDPNKYLQVGVMTDPSDTNTFVPVSGLLPITNDYLLYDVPLSDYNGDGTYITIVSRGASCWPKLDDLTLDYIPACTRPNNISVTPTETSATISWTSNASSYIVRYKKDSETDYTSLSDYESNGETYTATLEGLDANTAYSVIVDADCGTTLSSNPAHFRTLCATISTLPWVADFEGEGSGSTPNCWDKIPQTGTYPQIYNSTSYNHSSGGANSMKMYSTSTSDYQYAVLPPFEESLQNLSLSFYALVQSTASSGVLEVGVLVDPEDETSFVQVFSVNSTQYSGTYIYNSDVYELTLASVTSATENSRIAFRYKPTSSYGYGWYLDDVTVYQTPDCTRPVLAGVTTTTTTAKISYTSSGDDFTVYYKTSSETDYSSENSSEYDENTGTYSTTIENLTASTTYDYYVIANCSDGSTPESAHSSFSTPCAGLTAEDLPKTWDFESDNTGGTTAGPLPACWSRWHESWPKTYTSASNAHSGSSYIWFYDPNRFISLTPIDESVSVNELQLSFYAKGNAAAGKYLQVGVMSNPADTNTFEPVGGLIELTSSYSLYEQSLSSYEGEGRYISIVSRGTSSWPYLDDLTLMFIPSCSRPSALEATTTEDEAVLSWASSASSFEVMYKKSNETDFVAATGNIESQDANNHSMTLTGLSSATSYQWYVVANCNNEDLQSVTMSFTTACPSAGISDYPWFEGFENEWVTSSVFDSTKAPSCWTMYNGGVTSSSSSYNQYYYSWYRTTTSSDVLSGNGAAKCFTDYATALHNDWLITPLLSLDGNKQLTFYARRATNTTTEPDQISIYISDEDAQISAPATTNDPLPGFTKIASFEIPMGEYSAYDVSLNDYTGNRYVAFVRDSLPNDGYFLLLDDVTIYNSPDCTRPTNFAVDEQTITPTQASLSWTSSAENYTVYYKADSESSYTAYQGNNTVESDGENRSLILDGLSTDTKYKVYIVATCNNSIELESAKIEFRTACSTIVLDDETSYLQDFASSENLSCWTLENTGNSDWYVSAGALYHSYSSGTTADAISPVFDLSSVSTPYVKFSHKQSGTDSRNNLTVLYRASEQDEWTEIANYTQNIPDYVNDSVALPNPSATYQINFRWSNPTPNNYNGSYLDNVKVYNEENPPSCVKAENVNVSTTASTATVTWTQPDNASAWIVYYKKSSETDYTSSEELTQTSYSFDVEPSTSYTLYVSTVCGDDESSYPASDLVNFSTPCIPSEIPWSENFESYSEAAIPSCWNLINTTSTSYTSGVVPNNSHLGNNSYQMYSANSNNNYLVLPVFDEDLSNLTLNFWSKAESSSYSGTLYVGYMTNASDANTFTSLMSIPASSNTSYTMYELPFTDLTIPEGARITFRNITTNSYYFWFLDDISVDLTPTCTRASNLNATATATGATLTWSSTGTSFEVYYKPAEASDFVLAQTNVTSNGADSWSAELTGLTPATSYDWKVKALCDDENQPESNVSTFVTSCVALTSADLPKFWNFESGNTAGTTSYPLPPCWNRTNDVYPYVYNSTYSSYNSDRCLYSYRTYIVSLPQIDVNDLNISTLMMSFYAKAPSTSSSSSLQVGVMTDPTDESTFVATETINLSTTYTSYDMSLSGYNGGGTYPAIKFICDYTSIYIDDLTLSIGASCSRPVVSQISTSTDNMSISWTSTGSNFEIYYKAAGESEYTAAGVSAQQGDNDTWSASVSGLTPGTTYSVYVAVTCDDGTVAQSITSNATTLCEAVTEFPYLETATGDNFTLPNCWVNLNMGTNNYSWKIIDNVFQHPYNEGGRDMLTSPLLDLSNLTNPYLRFNYEVRSDASGNCDSLKVYYRNVENGEWTLIGEYGTATATGSASTWTANALDSLALPNQSDHYQIGFLGVGRNGWGVYVDNVKVYDNSTIEPPAPVEPTVQTNAASNVTETSATLNGAITSAGNQTITARGFEWKATNGGTYAVVNSTETTDAFTYALTGLTAETSYTYRAFATTANGTVYGDEISFTTLAAVVTPVEPTVQTNAASNVTENSATLNGAITSAGNQTITARGFEWKATNGGTYAVVNSTETTDAFTYALTGLTAETSYTYRAFATTANGTVYGTEVNFTTLAAAVTPVEPTVVTNAASDVSATSAVLNGAITDAGNQTITARGFEWKATNGGTYAVVNSTETTDAFTYALTGLTAETSYTYRAFATTANGTVYGDELNFTTLSAAGLNDAENSLRVVLYPNPATSNATLSVEGLTSNAEVTLTDQSGRVVRTLKLAQGQTSLTIETSGLASGVYYVRIQSDNILRTEKLIKR